MEFKRTQQRKNTLIFQSSGRCEQDFLSSQNNETKVATKLDLTADNSVQKLISRQPETASKYSFPKRSFFQRCVQWRKVQTQRFFAKSQQGELNHHDVSSIPVLAQLCFTLGFANFDVNLVQCVRFLIVWNAYNEPLRCFVRMPKMKLNPLFL